MGSEIDLAPLSGVVFERGRAVAIDREPWLKFVDLTPFAARFVEIVYRASVYDDPVRPVLKFETAKGVVERLLPGPVAGEGIWRGAVPRKTTSVSICPCARTGRFDFRVERVTALSVRDMARLIWRSRPEKLWSIALALTFGFFAEAERAMNWAIGGEPCDAFASWSAQRKPPLDLYGLDAPRFDWSRGPRFLIFVDAKDASAPALERTRAALAAQIYGSFTAVSKAPDAAAMGRALQDCDFVLCLRAGDALEPHALAAVVEESARAPAKVIYADETILTQDGPRPELKPDWSPIFEEARSYLGRAVFLRRDCLPSLGQIDAAAFHEAARKAAFAAPLCDVRHLRRSLLTRDAEPALSAATPVAPAATPSVSVVILTKDRADLLGPCLDSLLRLSTHTRLRSRRRRQRHHATARPGHSEASGKGPAPARAFTPGSFQFFRLQQ